MAKKLIFTTDYTKAGLTFEYYKEFLTESGVALDELPTSVEKSNFWEWVNDEQDMEFNDLKENIKYGAYNTECYITGSVGLWCGRREIAKTHCDTLLEAIQKCINDQDDFEIYVDGNAVYVDSYNHDSRFYGGNYFKIVIKGKKIKGGYLF